MEGRWWPVAVSTLEETDAAKARKTDKPDEELCEKAFHFAQLLHVLEEPLHAPASLHSSLR